MRVLIHFQPKRKDTQNYEGMRVLKNIVEQCRISGISFTHDPLEQYDIAHFVGVQAQKYIKNAHLRKVPIIVSVLAAENDPDARLLENKEGKYSISSRDQATLKLASLIIVPTPTGKNLLKQLEVNVPVAVVPEAVMKQRFDRYHQIEKGIFARYFNFNSKKKLVVANGPYTKEGGVSDYIQIAKQFPQVDFYYFGPRPNVVSFGLFKRQFKNMPSNVYLNKTVHEDVYRSALINADVYVVPGYQQAGIVSLLDPMISQCQIIARKGTVDEDLVINNKTGYIVESNYEIEKTIEKVLNGEIINTSQAAHKRALQYDIEIIAPRIKKIYETQLEK